MGIVFRATDLALGRTVALKVIAPDAAGNPIFRARFERESRVAAAIEHPHVVQIYHAGQDEGLLYLTMRYVDGTDLRRLLRRESRLDPARAVSILGQIAGALDEAHVLGLVHRDVKPANVLLAQRSGRDHAYLTDFGITRRAGDEHLTRTGVTLGSVDYIAPPRRLVALNPELPPGLQDVLDRALAKNPGDRQQSATQLAQDATAALGHG